jgi:hypothetical protein
MTLEPTLSTLPPPQLRFFPELDAVPEYFTLYGGTALALRLGHRSSVDFDFFSNQPVDPGDLAKNISFLKEAERVQVAPNTLKCRVERGGPILISFFGGLELGQAAPRDRVAGRRFYVASLLDIAGTKAAVVQQRAEAKDYIDMDALILNGIDLPTALSAGKIIYGRAFNPVITLKALSFFDDLATTLPVDVRKRLAAAVKAVDTANLPVLAPYTKRADKSGDRK